VVKQGGYETLQRPDMADEQKQATPLLYFKKRGRGSQCRLASELLGFPTVDQFVTCEELATGTPENPLTPYGSVPCLILPGMRLGQGCAVLQYMAEATGKLHPTPEGRARELSLAMSAEDLRIGYFKFFGTDEAFKKKFVDTTFPRWFGNWERILSEVDGDWFSGRDEPGYSDAAVWDSVQACQVWVKGTNEALAPFAGLLAWLARFEAFPAVAAFLASERYLKG